METLKFNVFNLSNKLKKTTVPLVLLCPTFPYFLTSICACKHWFMLSLYYWTHWNCWWIYHF